MKKIISIILAVTLLMCIAVPVLADNTHQSELSFTLEVAKPSYTITVPAYFGEFFICEQNFTTGYEINTYRSELLT